MYWLSNNYIAHHGIKGQRWGVRRYQNNDGSYTNAGKKRYTSSTSMSKSERRMAKKAERGQKSFERGNRIEDIQGQKARIHAGFRKATPVLTVLNAGLGYMSGNRYNGPTAAMKDATLSAISTAVQMKGADFIIGKVEDARISNLRAYYQREGKYGQSEPKKNYA